MGPKALNMRVYRKLAAFVIVSSTVDEPNQNKQDWNNLFNSEYYAGKIYIPFKKINGTNTEMIFIYQNKYVLNFLIFVLVIKFFEFSSKYVLQSDKSFLLRLAINEIIQSFKLN